MRGNANGHYMAGDDGTAMTRRNATGTAANTAIKAPAVFSASITGGPNGWVAVTLMAICIALVYGRSLDVPFIFDDESSIVSNPSITSLWPPIGTLDAPGPLRPVKNLPTAGRPLVNLSLALNYHFGRLNPVGYRVVNLVVHFCSTMLLWAIVRRTLCLPRFDRRFASVAGWLSLGIALLWALHPIQTEAVIYATQRTELMMAFFYLATLYCSLRYWSLEPTSERNARHRSLWLLAAIVSCICGMASKEVMVSAPLVVLLFDRAFVSGSLSAALHRSRPLYVGLAASWLVLLGLNLSAPRGASAGFELGRARSSWWLTQCQIHLMYLKLVIWPFPLLIHYELPYLDSLAASWMYVLPVLALAIVALVLLVRNTPAGFLLAAMAAVLAPTFVIPILTEMAAERRMYLPLAPVVVLFIMGCYLAIDSARKRATTSQPSAISRPAVPVPAIAAATILIVLCGVASARRLVDYRDESQLWRQVVERQPGNYMAHYNMGMYYNRSGREAESFAELQKAVAARPDYPPALDAIGIAYFTAGRVPEAVESLETALRLQPDYVPALNNLGFVRMQSGQIDEALDLFRRALELNGANPVTLERLGSALISAGRPDEAISALRLARSLAPDDVDVLNQLATALSAVNQLPEAIDLLRRAVELRPDYAGARRNLGIILFRAGDLRGAADHFQRYLELRPEDLDAYLKLATIVAGLGEHQQAARLLEHGLKLQPDSPEANFMYANELAQLGSWPAAIERYQKTIQLQPALLPAYVGLAESLTQINRLADAVEVANQGIKAARAAGDANFAAQLEAWIKQRSAPESSDKRDSQQSPAVK